MAGNQTFRRTVTGPQPAPPAEAEARVRTVLFLTSDTGGGHRRAAEAVIEAMAARYPGEFRPVLCDPLAGPAAARPLRCLARLYGPLIRWAPWAWGAAYYVTNSRPAMAVLWRTVFAPAVRPVAEAVAAVRPSVIVSCHPLTGRAAVRAARRVPVITLVTDLVSVHSAWRHPGAQHVAVPTAQAGARFATALPGAAWTVAGLPAAVGAPLGPLPAAERVRVRRRLGVAEDDFLVLLTGGAEGCGGLARRAKAIIQAVPEAHVAIICGRNERLRRQLSAYRPGADRLLVLGFVTNIGDWLRCADVVVTKAGPGIIAEAACCAAPMLLTSHLPGQERGNSDLVTQAGAGRDVRGIRDMLRVIGELASDPGTLALLRDRSCALARPSAAAEVADLIAAHVSPRPPAADRDSRYLLASSAVPR